MIDSHSARVCSFKITFALFARSLVGARQMLEVSHANTFCQIAVGCDLPLLHLSQRGSKRRECLLRLAAPPTCMNGTLLQTQIASKVFELSLSGSASFHQGASKRQVAELKKRLVCR